VSDIDNTLQLIHNATEQVEEAANAIRAAMDDAEENRDELAARKAEGVAQLMDACKESLEEAPNQCNAITNSLEEASARANEAKEAS
jgi:DNA repair ATPase RecN